MALARRRGGLSAFPFRSWEILRTTASVLGVLLCELAAMRRGELGSIRLRTDNGGGSHGLHGVLEQCVNQGGC